MSAISITPANVKPSSGITPFRGTAGATIAAGNTCYLDLNTNKIKLLDANVSAAASLFKGIAVSAAFDGQPVLMVAEDPEFEIGATVPAGTILICSGTAGAICEASDAAEGWYVTVLGVMGASNKLVLKPVAGRTPVPPAP